VGGTAGTCGNPACRAENDRDVNAALNIRDMAFQRYTSSLKPTGNSGSQSVKTQVDRKKAKAKGPGEVLLGQKSETVRSHKEAAPSLTAR
jgi:hypothetical protein